MKKFVLVFIILSIVVALFGIVYYLNTKAEEKDRQKLSLVLTKMIDDNHLGIIDKVDLSLLFYRNSSEVIDSNNNYYRKEEIV